MATSKFDGLPPVVQILLSEELHDSDLRNPDDYLKRLLPELRRQAEWTLEHDGDFYIDRSSVQGTGLTIDPAAGLDPFSDHGKCSDPRCRLHNADFIARTMGLYADFAVIGDPFTDHLVVPGKWTTRDSTRFMVNLLVLRRLSPLFEARVFRFADNFVSLCSEHSKQFTAEVKKVAEDVLEEAKGSFTVTRRGDVLNLKTTDFFGVPLNHIRRIDAKLEKKLRGRRLNTMGRELLAPIVYEEVHETLFKMRRAAHLHPVTFSNSRASMLAARRFETRTPNEADLEIWEASRSAVLPWVNALTPSQIVELRNEAGKALPRFRERMRQGLTAGSSTEAAQVVRNLREEAAEVKAELDAMDARGESRFRNAAGVLGMTVSVYGFAGEFVVAGAALTGLGSLFGLLHAAGHNERKELGKLTTKPGYVLVKAKELAEHAPVP